MTAAKGCKAVIGRDRFFRVCSCSKPLSGTYNSHLHLSSSLAPLGTTRASMPLVSHAQAEYRCSLHLVTCPQLPAFMRDRLTSVLEAIDLQDVGKTKAKNPGFMVLPPEGRHPALGCLRTGPLVEDVLAFLGALIIMLIGMIGNHLPAKKYGTL